jgi:hypothetical protein
MLVSGSGGVLVMGRGEVRVMGSGGVLVMGRGEEEVVGKGEVDVLYVSREKRRKKRESCGQKKVGRREVERPVETRRKDGKKAMDFKIPFEKDSRKTTFPQYFTVQSKNIWPHFT